MLCITISLAAYYSQIFLFILALTIICMIVIAIIAKAELQLLITLGLAFLMLLNSMNFIGISNSVELKDKLNINASFTVYETENISNDYVSLYAEIKDCEKIKKGTRLLVYSRYNEFEIGKGYTANLSISKFQSTTQRKSFFGLNVFAMAFADNVEAFQEQDDFVLELVNKTRNYIKTSLFSNLRRDEATTLCALIFGKKDYFTDTFYSNVKKAGVSHVMVVSGMHLAITVSLLERIVRKLFYNRYLRALIILFSVLFIMTLCGFTLSIKRAGITYILLALGLMLKREGCPENLLGAAVSATLIFSPFAILNLGFQLTALSTFGILVVSIPITRYLNNRFKIPKPLMLIIESCVTTLSAILLTLPIIILAFGWISKYAVLFNLAISFAVTLAIWITYIALIVNLFVPFIARTILFPIDGLVTKYVNDIINAVEYIKNPIIEIPNWAAVYVIVLILAVLSVLIYCKKQSNMVKSEIMYDKIKKEIGRNVKWQ